MNTPPISSEHNTAVEFARAAASVYVSQFGKGSCNDRPGHLDVVPEGGASQEEAWFWYQWDSSTSDHDVLVQNVPRLICGSNFCVQAMLQQAGLQPFVVSFEALRRKGKVTGELRLTLTSEMAALSCIKWFTGCVWERNKSSKPVSAMLLPAKGDDNTSVSTKHLGSAAVADLEPPTGSFSCDEVDSLKFVEATNRQDLLFHAGDSTKCSDSVGFSDSEQSTAAKTDRFAESMSDPESPPRLSRRRGDDRCRWADLSDEEGGEALV